MPIVRTEHAVPNFEKWKQAFDNDPVRSRPADRVEVIEL
jgi:hypothetical protein